MNYNPNLIDEWIADEDRVITAVRNGSGFGLATPTEIRGLSGMQIIEAMMKGAIPVSQFADHMSFCTVGFDEVTGIVTFQGALKYEYLNPMGSVHGGWMSTVLDSAMGTAVLLRQPAGKSFVTDSLTVDFKTKLSRNVDRVRIEGRTVEPPADTSSRDRARYMWAAGRIYDIHGTVYAHATCKCRVFSVPQE